MAVTKQKGRTHVAPRKKMAAKKVGAATKRKTPKVPHTNSHNHPHEPKRGGNKAHVRDVPQGVSVVEYPGEGKRGGRGGGFKGVKTVGHNG